MRIDILTIFPEMFKALDYSILSRAQKNNLLNISITNIRDFSLDSNKRCDDYSYGGGAGMIMSPQPLMDAIQSVKKENSYVIYMSPKGNVLNQEKVEKLAKMDKDLVLICGHYEGIDERVIDLCVDEEISVGDYVLTGGELPAMILIDSVARYIPNVLGNSETTEIETFTNNLLEYPQYTRPSEFQGLKVPDILLTGNHKEVEDWRLSESMAITKKRRPDLYKKFLNDNNLFEFENNVYLKELFDAKILQKNINKLQITELGKRRLQNNLQIENKNPIYYCRARILDKRCKVIKKGKNYYCTCGKVEIVVNSNTYTIITAKYIK